MPTVDHSYGRLPVLFPDRPYASAGKFAAFITSFLPIDQAARRERLTNLHRQLRWWRLMTDMPVNVFASNWTQAQIDADTELSLLPAHGGSVTSVPPQPLVLNRIACLKAFYASSYPWGVIMDDDAILYDSPAHNSGGAFFSQMARNTPAPYDGVDVFYPINPAKLPGQNQIWAKAPGLYADHHVFDAGYDLKGSLFVIRNFPLYGRPAILPPASHLLHGEDTLFAVEAVSKGCTVFRCGNMVLKELSGPSHFQHTKAVMRQGNQAIASLYAAQGLRMSGNAARSHLLDRSDFLRLCLTNARRRITVAKP